MFTDKISDYFEGVAANYLSAVDADQKRSNGLEIEGLPAAGAKSWLGTPGKGNGKKIKTSVPIGLNYRRDGSAADTRY